MLSFVSAELPVPWCLLLQDATAATSKAEALDSRDARAVAAARAAQAKAEEDANRTKAAANEKAAEASAAMKRARELNSSAQRELAAADAEKSEAERAKQDDGGYKPNLAGQCPTRSAGVCISQPPARGPSVRACSFPRRSGRLFVCVRLLLSSLDACWHP